MSSFPLESTLNVVAIEHWPLARLLPYTRTPRNNDPAVDQMAASILEFGFRIPCVAKSTGERVDGHLRRRPKSRCFACSPIVPRPELRPFQGWAIAGCWGNTVCYAAMQPWRTAIRRCWMKRPVDLIWTDPPYNVDYPNVSKNHPAFNRKRPILNDRLGARFRDFPGEALTGMLPRCKGAVYI